MILVFDITNIESFRAIEVWVAQIQKESQEDVKILLIGNKTDMEHERKVSTNEAKTLAERLGMAGYVETSAKEGTGIDAAFNKLASAMMGTTGTVQENSVEKGFANFNNPDLSGSSSRQNKKCCT